MTTHGKKESGEEGRQEARNEGDQAAEPDVYSFELYYQEALEKARRQAARETKGRSIGTIKIELDDTATERLETLATEIRKANDRFDSAARSTSVQLAAASRNANQAAHAALGAAQLAQDQTNRLREMAGTGDRARSTGSGRDDRPGIVRLVLRGLAMFFRRRRKG